MAVQSIDRAFQVLKALAVEPSGVTDLAQRVGLPKSTVARMLSSLEDQGAVTRGPDGTMYCIGMGLVELAGAIDATAALATAVRPHLVWLSDQLGEAAGFSIPTGYTIQYMVQVESPNPVQVRDYTGLTVPMHVGPSGLCVMAQWPAEEVDRYLGRPLEVYTANTVVDPGRIQKRLDSVRVSGHCWVREEFAEGINSVAAPVLADGKRALGAIHVHGPTYRFPVDGRADAIASLVMDAAARFSSRSDTV
ncbi:MAG: IclR family transcriptional regulator [Acidimicrobiia bacterium]|jgi:IclR family transcriptional regulator, acetate operon repressor